MTAHVRVTVAGAAAAELARWLAACRARRGALPAACAVVQRRLVRAVGVGELPGVGRAFVKVMAFPRARDRLRYVHRPLPGQHEARVLEALAARAPDLPCPEPLAVLADRSPFGLPRLSVLVTRGLPVAVGVTPSLADRVRAAARLCDAGVEHGDLHAGNFVALTDGRTAVLDLQSARVLRGPVTGARRRAVAAKLAEALDGARVAELAAAGLIADGEVDAVRAAAATLRRATLRRRVRRCLTESSGFAVGRTVGATTVVRRGADGRALTAIADARARDLWLGDRAREVLDGATPLLAGVRLPWFGGRVQVLVDGDDPRAQVAAARPVLLDAYGRYRALTARG